MNNKLNSIYRMLAVIVILALTLIMTGCDTEYVQSQIQNSVNDYLESIESDLNVSSEVNSSNSSNDTFGGVSSSGGSNNSSSPAAVGSSSSNTSSDEKQNNPISSEVIEDFHENIQSQDPEPEEPEEVTPVIDPGFSGGDGTENNPYIITTAKELVYFSEKINKGELNNGVYFALGADIDMTDVDNFFPIGTQSHRFSSYFDGRGFTVSNLTPRLAYYHSGNNGSYRCGFFGIVRNAEIKNLRLENVNIIQSYSTKYFTEIGILASYVCPSKECKITDCFVSGNINVSTNILLVGGVVGSISVNNNAKLIFERVQSNTKLQVSSEAVNAGAVSGCMSGAGQEIFSDVCANSIIIHNSKYSSYIGAFGAASVIMGNMRVSNCFFNINTQINPNDEIHPIIGGIIDSSNPNGTFEFINVFGFIKGCKQLYEISSPNTVIENNCSVTKVLPTTCNFNTEIWDVTDPAAPFIKFNFEKN